MSKKIEFISQAIFYAKENPQVLAKLISGTITDVATSVIVAGASEVTKGETTVTSAYTAEVLSQFGDAMTGQTVTWSVTTATGVTITDGTLSVTSSASAGNVTITATCGSLTGTKIVTIKAV